MGRRRSKKPKPFRSFHELALHFKVNDQPLHRIKTVAGTSRPKSPIARR